MEGINERLMDLINRSGFTQKEVAEKAGITEAAMSHYLKVMLLQEITSITLIHFQMVAFR